jgi:predicted CoA-binding protein
MPSIHQEFWEGSSFAVVGHSRVKPFPMLTYAALRSMPEKMVVAVDPSRESIEGDPCFADLSRIPEPVEAVVLEVPKEETASWVEAAANHGVRKIWIHMGRETPEALSLAAEHGIEVCTGTCAVQYLDDGFPHNVHRFLRKLSGRW